MVEVQVNGLALTNQTQFVTRDGFGKLVISGVGLDYCR